MRHKGQPEERASSLLDPETRTGLQSVDDAANLNKDGPVDAGLRVDLVNLDVDVVILQRLDFPVDLLTSSQVEGNKVQDDTEYEILFMYLLCFD